MGGGGDDLYLVHFLFLLLFQRFYQILDPFAVYGEKKEQRKKKYWYPSVLEGLFVTFPS